LLKLNDPLLGHSSFYGNTHLTERSWWVFFCLDSEARHLWPPA